MGGVDVPVDHILKLTVEWNDNFGDYQYTLTKLNEFSNGERGRTASYSGDKAWAKRIAKHYGLELPEVTK